MMNMIMMVMLMLMFPIMIMVIVMFALLKSDNCMREVDDADDDQSDAL